MEALLCGVVEMPCSFLKLRLSSCVDLELRSYLVLSALPAGCSGAVGAAASPPMSPPSLVLVAAGRHTEGAGFRPPPPREGESSS